VPGGGPRLRDGPRAGGPDGAARALPGAAPGLSAPARGGSAALAFLSVSL
jgi:hypothetical protein